MNGSAADESLSNPAETAAGDLCAPPLAQHYGVSLDADWCIAHADAEAWRLLGGSGNAAGARLFDAAGSGADHWLWHCLRASKAENVPLALSLPAPGSAGEWIELGGRPVSGGYALHCRDVTAERRVTLAEAATSLRESTAARIHRRVFETTLDLILVVERRGTIIEVSPSSQTLLGYAPAEMIGRNAREFLYPADLDNTREEMRQARRGRLMRNFETRYVHRDGHVVPLAWTGIWSDAEQQHFFVGRDMAERIAAEERLRRAQRLESVGQLTGGIAHDFNNLLTVVIGNIDLLKGRIAGNAAAEALAERALDASMRGASLTRQLLAFARRQPLEPKVVEPNERILATLDLLRRTLGEQIEIVTMLGETVWPALVDPIQLDSAIVNLAINARDAMPEGGRLHIETANRRIDETYVAATFDAEPGDYVMIAVADSGTGMSPETLARVFEPFFTTKPAGRGTGLGLAMVYGFAKQSQGHVQIYSEEGRGTTVRLYLPRAGTDAQPATTDAETGPPRARAGERVLVVEDNAGVRGTVAAQLAELGYEAVEAEDGRAAMAQLAAGPGFDLLFTDVVMPGGISGFELARAARATLPGLKVLLTSGYHEGSLPTQSEEAFPILGKPYRKADLAAKIRAVLDG